ncbi:MAG: hypothetical protein HRU11_03765 [Parvularculaceae bacterium]|nr:hypothetical protein [Parvularculaceae bacterium]
MIWRALSVVWIAFTLLIQVFALTALFDAWQVADTAWRDPFAQAGRYYAIAINLIAQYVGTPAAGLMAEIPILNQAELPCWWVHILAMYAAAASAVWVGSMSRDERNNRIAEVKRGGFSILWPLAIAGLITQGLRNQVVTSFARQHSGTVVFYGVASLALYAGANWANINVLTGAPAPGQEVSLVNEIQCPLVRTDDVPQSLGDVLPEEIQQVLPE